MISVSGLGVAAAEVSRGGSKAALFVCSHLYGKQQTSDVASVRM